MFISSCQPFSPFSSISDIVKHLASLENIDKRSLQICWSVFTRTWSNSSNRMYAYLKRFASLRSYVRYRGLYSQMNKIQQSCMGVVRGFISWCTRVKQTFIEAWKRIATLLHSLATCCLNRNNKMFWKYFTTWPLRRLLQKGVASKGGHFKQRLLQKEDAYKKAGCFEKDVDSFTFRYVYVLYEAEQRWLMHRCYNFF